jgi:hypothetical protein
MIVGSGPHYGAMGHVTGHVYMHCCTQHCYISAVCSGFHSGRNRRPQEQRPDPGLGGGGMGGGIEPGTREAR